MSRYASWFALSAVLIAAVVGSGLYLEMPLSTHRELREDGDVRVYQCDYEGKLHGTETYHFASGVLHRMTEYEHGARVLGLEYWPSGRLMMRWQEGPNYTHAAESFPDEP